MLLQFAQFVASSVGVWATLQFGRAQRGHAALLTFNELWRASYFCERAKRVHASRFRSWNRSALMRGAGLQSGDRSFKRLAPCAQTSRVLIAEQGHDPHADDRHSSAGRALPDSWGSEISGVPEKLLCRPES